VIGAEHANPIAEYGGPLLGYVVLRLLAVNMVHRFMMRRTPELPRTEESAEEFAALTEVTTALNGEDLRFYELDAAKGILLDDPYQERLERALKTGARTWRLFWQSFLAFAVSMLLIAIQFTLAPAVGAQPSTSPQLAIIMRMSAALLFVAIVLLSFVGSSYHVWKFFLFSWSGLFSWSVAVLIVLLIGIAKNPAVGAQPSAPPELANVMRMSAAFLFVAIVLLSFVGRRYYATGRVSLFSSSVAVLVSTVFGVVIGMALALPFCLYSLPPFFSALVVFFGYERIRCTARAAGNIKLLILRVFGSDRNTPLVFGPLMRKWQFLGSYFTIVDPSYIRHQFSLSLSETRWKLFWFFYFYCAFILFFSLGVSSLLRLPPTNPAMEALRSLNEIQRIELFSMVVWLILIPLAALPVVAIVKNRFIPSLAQLTRRIDAAKQQDGGWSGAFKGFPMYCYDNVWKRAVHALFQVSDVVLMDLRGFSPARLGCEYEIGLLINQYPLQRTIFLVDRGDAKEGVYQLIRRRWAEMNPKSPNRNLPSPTVKVYALDDENNKHDIPRILALLATSVEKETEGASGMVSFDGALPQRAAGLERVKSRVRWGQLVARIPKLLDFAVATPKYGRIVVPLMLGAVLGLFFLRLWPVVSSLKVAWAITQAAALTEQGRRSEGAKGAELLNQAVAAYRSALEVRTREQLPQRWAQTQESLGEALAEEGRRSEGAKGAELFNQAVAAYRSALEVYTREQLPQDWAMTQNNLANALWELGTCSGGEEGRKLLEDAVAACRSALEVYTKTGLPQDWARTQNILGAVLSDLGTRSGGEEGRKLLTDAVAAYRSALEIRTKADLPQDWAQTQNNLGAALQDLGRRSGAEEGRKLLTDAVAACRSALEVYTKADLPQGWAMTQNNLGNAFWDLGTRSGVEEGRKLLTDAVAAYRNALEVFTKADLPQAWAQTQNNLGVALSDLGRRSGAEEGRKLLEDAVAAYRSALEVRTKADLPQAWATTQNNLANVLWTLGSQSEGEEGLKHKHEAVELLRDVMSYQSDDQSRDRLASALGDLAFELVLNRQFAEAQAHCEEAEKLTNEIGDGIQKTDRDNLIFIQGNLAHALLFQGHYDEALTIYRENWDKPLHKKTFGEITLEDFAAFDKAGLNHPDLSRMKQALRDLGSEAPSP
jgi:tetratricopeptide (TPR) repeat protein